MRPLNFIFHNEISYYQFHGPKGEKQVKKKDEIQR